MKFRTTNQINTPSTRKQQNKNRLSMTNGARDQETETRMTSIGKTVICTQSLLILYNTACTTFPTHICWQKRSENNKINCKLRPKVLQAVALFYDDRLESTKPFVDAPYKIDSSLILQSILLAKNVWAGFVPNKSLTEVSPLRERARNPHPLSNYEMGKIVQKSFEFFSPMHFERLYHFPRIPKPFPSFPKKNFQPIRVSIAGRPQGHRGCSFLQKSATSPITHATHFTARGENPKARQVV